MLATIGEPMAAIGGRGGPASSASRALPGVPSREPTSRARPPATSQPVASQPVAGGQPAEAPAAGVAGGVGTPGTPGAAELAPAEPPDDGTPPPPVASRPAPPASSTAGAVPPTSAPARPSSARRVEVPEGREWLRPLFVRHARSAGVPADLAMALAWRESSWRVNARSSVGAMGVMQLMPATVKFTSTKLLGRRGPLDPWSADSNIQMGTRFLAHLIDRFDGDLQLALAAYHQGTTSVLEDGTYTVSRRFAASVLALRSSFAR